MSELIIKSKIIESSPTTVGINQVCKRKSYRLPNQVATESTLMGLGKAYVSKLTGKSEQKEYCPVIFDGFNASSAVNALKKVVCLFVASKRVAADQGWCYASSQFKSFCANHNIDLHFIATGSSTWPG